MSLGALGSLGSLGYKSALGAMGAIGALVAIGALGSLGYIAALEAMGAIGALVALGSLAALCTTNTLCSIYFMSTIGAKLTPKTLLKILPLSCLYLIHIHLSKFVFISWAYIKQF